MGSDLKLFATSVNATSRRIRCFLKTIIFALVIVLLLEVFFLGVSVVQRS